jgi:glycosyltransferase involved in cell wall biosynthesis
MRVVHQVNQGLSAARNTGILATDSPFYVALDADDRIAPCFISRLVDPLLKDPTIGYCYSHVEFFGAASGVWACEAYNPRKLMVQNLSVATAVVRRAAFDLVGGYSRDMVHGFEDWDFWLALLSVGYHGHCVAEPLFHYRKHPRGQSMLDSTQRHRADMVQQMVQHHRALFASMLEVSISDKDAMFFEAHMQAFHLREAAAFTQNSGAVGESEVYRNLVAQAQLDYIENSRSWQFVQRLKQNAAYRALARWRFGRDWRALAQSGSPVERLDRIRHSHAYRLIQATKKTPFYRWHARRKYGPDYEKVLAETSQR